MRRGFNIYDVLSPLDRSNPCPLLNPRIALLSSSVKCMVLATLSHSVSFRFKNNRISVFAEQIRRTQCSKSQRCLALREQRIRHILLSVLPSSLPASRLALTLSSIPHPEKIASKMCSGRFCKIVNAIKSDENKPR